MTALEDAVHRWVLDAPADDLASEGPTTGDLGPGDLAPGDLVEEVRRRRPLEGSSSVRRTVGRIEARLVGLGPLEELLADDAVTDVAINGPGPVWVDRGRGMEPADVTVDRPTLDLLVERVVAPLGRRADPVHPVVDGRLPDGSRVHVVVPPLAVDGPYVTIRRFGARAIELDDVAAAPVAALLRDAVRRRANVVIVGGTGSGKTTVLNALAAALDPGERIVTVEDAAELRLPGPHVVRLETRPGSVDGPAGVDARDLVRSALRMRPDRLLLGEVRGGEALDLLQAMNTGHDGSLSTLHANGCADALRRLETLVLLAGVGLPIGAVRDHLAAAVDLVVHLERTTEGRRRVVEVAEVLTAEDSAVGADARLGAVPVRTLAVDDAVVAEPRRRWAAGAERSR